MSSRRMESDNAALAGEVAHLRGLLAKSRADCGHLKARLGIVDERLFNGDHKGLAALQSFGETPCPEFPGCVF